MEEIEKTVRKGTKEAHVSVREGRDVDTSAISMLRHDSTKDLVVLTGALELSLGRFGRVDLRNLSTAKLDCKEIRALAVLCPLYTQSSLAESELIPGPKNLLESRVGLKFQVYVEAAKTLKDFAENTGRSMSFQLLFADTGVLLAREPTSEDNARLAAHRKLYFAEAQKHFGSIGVPFEMKSFSEMSGQPITMIPKYIITNSNNNAMPKPKYLLNEISKDLDMLGIDAAFSGRDIRNSIVGDMMSMKGATPEMLKGLVETYLASELSFPELLGAAGIFVNAERFSPLLRMPEMLKQSKDLQRVDVRI